MIAFVVGSALIMLGVADETKVIKSQHWNVLMLVVGVGILMKIILTSGGIESIVDSLSNLMKPKSASGIMGIAAGILSFFSSRLGIVFPTLIPTVAGIVENVGGMTNAFELVSMVVIGCTFTGISPVSTAGALILAGVSSYKQVEEKYPTNKLFSELFAWAFAFLIIDAMRFLKLIILEIYLIFQIVIKWETLIKKY